MWEGEVQLTCKQARVSPHGMSHDPGNTAEDILQITEQETDCHSWISFKKKYTKKYNPPKLFLGSLSLSPAIIHFSLLLTGNRRTLKHVAAPTSEHEISELCCRRKRCTVERHPLPLQRVPACTLNHFSTSFFLPACTSGDKYSSLHMLCEGYQGCLLNSHHVWNTILKPRRPVQPW